MSDDARKRARKILSEVTWCFSDLEDAMVNLVDERLEKAAMLVEARRDELPADQSNRLRIAAIEIRSFKSTTPKPPETREQRLERALRDVLGCAQHHNPKDWCDCVYCQGARILQDHGDEGEM